MSVGDDAVAEYCSRMFQIRKTVWTMLGDRGFEVPAGEHEMSMKDFRRTCTDLGEMKDSSLLTMRAEKEGASKRRALVLFSGRKDKFATDDVKYLFHQIDEEWKNQRMDSDNADQLTAALVIHKNMTSFAKKFLVAEHSKRNHGAADGVPRMRLDLNVFFEVELVVNIMEHHMVPKHSVLTKEAKKALLARYKVTDEQLPRILLADPVAKYLGLKRGQVLEIARKSETAGRYTTYRICL